MKLPRYALGAIACLLLTPAASHAGFLADAGGPTITVTGPAIGTPYPATLTVQGADGPITKVRAFATVNHSDPDGLDLALVPPTGNGVVLMSDACGGSPISLTFVFDPAAASTLVDEGPCSSGAFLPSNFSPADNWPSPGPAALTNTSLNAFAGRNPNGDWNLYALNDVNAVGANTISTWGLEITTATSQIVVPATGATSGVANQYPFTKTFDTPDGQVIDDLNLKLTSFNHQHPDDVDILLQGPTGEAAMVMSDACGSDDINTNFNWAFDDEAPVSFANTTSANCTANATKPVDFGDVPEDMPAPAPARPYGATMATFDGLAGGAFRLFINDDSNSDTGYIADWDVQMTTRPAAATGFAPTSVATAEGQTAELTVQRTNPGNLGPATLDVAVNDSDTDPSDYTAPPAKLQFARGEIQKTISIPITADLSGEEPETFFVNLANPANDASLSDATATATVTIARSEPDNRFTLGRVERKRNGSARIAVTIPSGGQLTSDDAGSKDLLKTTDAFPETAGTTMLKLKPEKKAKRKLKRGKKVRLTARITYTPNGGSANFAEAPVTLKRKR
jgi:subtilisin-like proprotein convertase family protein